MIRTLDFELIFLLPLYNISNSKETEASLVCENSYHMYKKPSLSYASLINEAICSTESKKMTLNNIYEYLKQKYSYFSISRSGWQVNSFSLLLEFH